MLKIAIRTSRLVGRDGVSEDDTLSSLIDDILKIGVEMIRTGTFYIRR